MKKLTALSIAAVVCALASPARAEDHHFTVGLRTAYALPLGTAGDGADLNELTSGAVPVQVELGYRLTRSWLAGAYAACGSAGVADEAKRALAAQGATNIVGRRVQRVGVQAIYSFLPEARFVPWAGVGFGYEWARYATADLTSATGEAEEVVGVRGFEGILQVGGDYRVTPRFTVGPFATVNVGQFQSHFSTVRETSGAFEGTGETSDAVDDKGIHEWIQLGVKGTFDF